MSHPDFDSLESRLADCLLRDRHRLRQQLASIRTAAKKSQPIDQRLERIERQIRQSVDVRQTRATHRPTVQFDASLPIEEKRTEIAAALHTRQVIVVAGETGSGKSTQLPKICLDEGFGTAAMIGHTQPRRIAARSVANRIAEELASNIGQHVGFRIRFTDKVSPQTYVKLMTDGILLAETQRDRFLEQYEVLILDEAHERSLNIDFLIGYLKQLLPKRPDLKLIITSATIDAERFAAHFSDSEGPAPVIQVSGRTYPVEVRYRPLVDDEEDEEIDVTTGIVRAVDELTAVDRGDILIFLPTERDIRETASRLRSETIRGDGNRKSEILPLYARLSAKEQNRIFQTGPQRRIILATNVAESSLTVPGIRYVIDTGTARISRYSPRSKVQRLPIEPVSQASADQRKGRCGRLGPGVAIRLYAQSDFDGRDRYTTPEIRRTNLASVILQAKTLKLGDIEKIPFIDKPRPEAIRDGYKTLFEIQAVDARQELTQIGRKVARLPVDPRIARIILAGDAQNCLHEILIIAAALEIQDPRERPLDRQQMADEKHEQFLNKESDFLSYLAIWDFHQHLKSTLSRNKLRKACQQNFLSHNRLREWMEIHRQLKELAKDTGMVVGTRRDDFGAIHRALLHGLLSGVAYLTGDHEYTGAGGNKFVLWPGSGLFSKKPKWIVTAEIVETTRRYGRTVSRISPNWIEPIAGHLVKRTYSDPHWHRKSSSVMAFERVNLSGMPVVMRRRVPFGPINPTESRKLFIQCGLVEQQLEISDDFYIHNCRLLADLQELAAKTRRREFIIDEYSVVMQYDQRLPEDAIDLASLRKCLRRSPELRKQLEFSQCDFVKLTDSQDYEENLFPKTIEVGLMQLPAEYHFEPGEDDDGVTLTVPLVGLRQLDQNQLDWGVPGLLEEKLVALIRSLPKQIRRNLVPAPDTAAEVTAQLDFGEGPFLPIVAKCFSRIAEVPIDASHFRTEKIAPHLRTNIRVIDDEGAVIGHGKDVAELLQALGTNHSEVRYSSSAVDSPWQRDDIREWDFGELPEQVTITRNGIPITAYPALITKGDQVQLRLLDNEPAASRHTLHGICHLFRRARRKSLHQQVRWLPHWDEMCLHAHTVISQELLKDQVEQLICLRALQDQKPMPRSQADFQKCLDHSVESISIATQSVAVLLPNIFEAFHKAKLSWEKLTLSRWKYAREDIEHQTSELFSTGFLVHTPSDWLEHYPRYLRAIEYRVDKLSAGGQARDEVGTEEVREFWKQYQKQQQKNCVIGIYDPALETFRWMLEEYRVSLFAQTLGTSQKVSATRLEKLWDRVKRS